MITAFDKAEMEREFITIDNAEQAKSFIAICSDVILFKCICGLNAAKQERGM